MQTNVKQLVEEYSNLGDFGKKEMKKNHPDIDFDKLLKEYTSGETNPDEAFEGMPKHLPGSSWREGLGTLAWLSFATMIFFGILTAVFSWQQGFSGGFIIFVLMTIGAFLMLAFIKVFIQMAKDTAEIKEILRSRGKAEQKNC